MSLSTLSHGIIRIGKRAGGSYGPAPATRLSTTDVEVCQELLHRYHSISLAQRAVQVVAEVLAAFPDAIGITVPIISQAAPILDTYPHLQARDAIHAAVVLEHSLEGIVTADTGFDGVDGVTRIDPREF